MQPIMPIEDLPEFELEHAAHSPMHYAVVGAADFVLGRVRTLLVDTRRHEVAYLVVSTRMAPDAGATAEERLVPLSWVELVHMRRQVRLPHLSRLAFRRLPLYEPGAVPEAVEFPTPSLEDPDMRDIA